MENVVRVKCIKCDEIFRISDDELPGEVRDGEAFVCFCPFCNERSHVVLEKERMPLSSK